MGETENRVILDRLYDRVWIDDTHDFEVMDEVFADDAVVEYPQSGERMRGRANIRAVEENYPGLPKVTIRRKVVVGDLALVESDLDYQGKPYQEVSIFEFRDGKMVRLTQYFPEPFQAPESRARWVETDAARTPTGLPRSARMSCDRGGCPLYPEDDGAPPAKSSP